LWGSVGEPTLPPVSVIRLGFIYMFGNFTSCSNGGKPCVALQANSGYNI